MAAVSNKNIIQKDLMFLFLGQNKQFLFKMLVIGQKNVIY